MRSHIQGSSIVSGTTDLKCPLLPLSSPQPHNMPLSPFFNGERLLTLPGWVRTPASRLGKYAVIQPRVGNGFLWGGGRVPGCGAYWGLGGWVGYGRNLRPRKGVFFPSHRPTPRPRSCCFSRWTSGSSWPRQRRAHLCGPCGPLRTRSAPRRASQPRWRLCYVGQATAWTGAKVRARER